MPVIQSPDRGGGARLRPTAASAAVRRCDRQRPDGSPPDRGDIVWLDFNPQEGHERVQIGHEQAGRRPAIAVSPLLYNEKSGLALFCPITSQAKGYPFEISLPKEYEIQGVILADQVKCLDWQARNARYVCKADSKIVDELICKLATLILR